MNNRLQAWVEECAQLTRPRDIYWCDGSDEEHERHVAMTIEQGILSPLNQREYPGCYLHRSHPNDVARVEHLTYICTRDEGGAGPTNNWMSVEKANARQEYYFRDSMRDRTMYVIPYVMGPVGSPFSKVGVEITDSLYVVENMRIMTRMGQCALDMLGNSGDFVPGLHSTGELDPNRRMIVHYPDERRIWSYGSGYGGNALLGKKCFALRIASALARDEGWLAEHMLILELEGPDGDLTYFAAAFPSACGKTNLAMLVSPLEEQGYKVRTVGDDIAWLHIGEDGRLWAVNPEAGYFGVVPGTGMNTNPNALITAASNSIYTNVAVSDDGIPWWEGKDNNPPDALTDWRGHRPWVHGKAAAHPNSRFTAPARQCPSISPRWEDPRGVPISAIIFGGRRYRSVPLVFEAFNWQHGTYLGATMASRTTAAAVGAGNVLRRDPMAMLPFCGYHMGDYFNHWLSMGTRLKHPPAIFHVNWFRRDASGGFMWPGFGDNVRALIWMAERIKGRADARETPIGMVPTREALPLDGLDVKTEVMDDLLSVKPEEWRDEVPEVRRFLAKFGGRMPSALWDEVSDLRIRLGA